MKNNKFNIFLMTSLLGVSVMSCSVLETEEVIDPNSPSVSSVLNNASKAQLDALAIGQVARARNGIDTYLQVMGTLGKELFNFNTTESRWMTELNGLRPIDNSAFYNGATTSFGPPVRQANTLLASLDKTTAVTEEQKNGYRGLANTFKGLAYLYQLNAQYTNGVRLNVEDPLKPSKFATYDESLAGIKKFLDDGAAQLDKAGASFAFGLPSTYGGFNTPANFKKFNRAIALRIALYQKDWSGASAILPQTFYSITGDINAGPSHAFNPTAPDVANPLLNTASVRVVAIDKIMDDAEAGDKRVAAKVTVLATPLTYSSGTVVSSKYLSKVYTTANQSVGIIRNEELILAAAEIAAQQGRTADAVANINAVRKAAGLADYKGATTQSALIDAILKERLYSLWYEGHRLVDMRRYGKLGEIFLPVAGMKVLEKLERPVAEVNWDKANP
jgi:starch-binding outer membrane protein, SusD/RagB family